ncbi:MAG: MarR family transcriptional regulator [Chloroflexi bacterium]|nr:MarR family transcriptional regulator [Chloroflexota bacterium]
MTTKQRGGVDRPAAIQRIIADLEQVLDALRSGIPSEWFTLELTMPQLRALFALLSESPSRMGALASHLGVSLSGATGLMDRLVEKGLAERWVDPEDRRSVMCRLSPQGRELGERLLRLRRTRWEERLAALTDEEMDCALQGLRALARGVALARSESAKAAGATGHGA